MYFKGTSTANGTVTGNKTQKKIKPYVILSGTQSFITEGKLIIKGESYLIRSQKELTNLWLKHVSLPKDEYDKKIKLMGVPQVDFENCMVVAIFYGSSLSLEGIEAVSIIEKEEIISFNLEERTLGISLSGNLSPYSFFIIQKHSKTIVLYHSKLGGLREWDRFK